MSGHKTTETLSLFAKFIKRTMGLHFSRERLPELEQKMGSLAREAGYADIEKYLLQLMSGPLSQEQLEALARTLTIGETYFLRDPRSYQVLVEELLPGLIAVRRATDKTLRIWSAGCSSGEEPYSIAILLSRAIPDLASWKIEILATDINPLALDRARRGVYSQWSFRNAPPWLMDYFTKRKDGRFEIIPRIRKMVRFSHLNLVQDAEGGAAKDGTKELDIIFCRNVMLYFDAAQIEKTISRFHAALKEAGWLFVGPTDVDHRLCKGFCCRHYGGAFVLRKVSTEQKGTVTPWSEILQFEQGGTAPAEKGTASFLIEAPPAPVAEPLAAPEPALAPPSGLILPEEIGLGTTELPGESGYVEALALYRAGRYEQAADLALRSLGAGEGQASALALGARAYANIGRFAEARECCEKAIACDRLSAHNHYLLSIILEQQGDTAGAIRSLKHALFIDHDYLLAYFALGNLSRQCGDQKESERYFANALRLLERRDPHEVLAEADGLTAGRLAQIIRAMTKG